MLLWLTMIEEVYVAFVLLLLLAIGLKLYAARWSNSKSDKHLINNPLFLSFQKKYFAVYFLALIAEWLQGPYLYHLYSHYGFIDTQIAVIYVCGFASSVIFGTYASFLSDSFGRKKVCILFTITYSLCCASKLSQNYLTLIFGRILGGISTSLLFSAFDSWYIHEHLQVHQFPSEWIDVTFSKATFYNSVIAVCSGIVSNLAAEELQLGPVAPFILAIPFLFVAGLLIFCTWDENYGKKGKLVRPSLGGLKQIIGSQKIFLTGAVQSLFESVMYVFVFLWTPVLKSPSHVTSDTLPLGIIFSCFMLCILIGGQTHKYVLKQRFECSKLIIGVIYVAMLANLIASYTNEDHPKLSFLMFLVIELLCGIYFPAMSQLRSQLLPPGSLTNLMNWFRVPLNLIAALALIGFHDTHTAHGISALFGLCVALLCGGGACAIQLHRNIDHFNLVSSNQMEEQDNTNAAEVI